MINISKEMKILKKNKTIKHTKPKYKITRLKITYQSLE